MQNGGGSRARMIEVFVTVFITLAIRHFYVILGRPSIFRDIINGQSVSQYRLFSNLRLLLTYVKIK